VLTISLINPAVALCAPRFGSRQNLCLILEYSDDGVGDITPSKLAVSVGDLVLPPYTGSILSVFPRLGGKVLGGKDSTPTVTRPYVIHIKDKAIFT
jgi:hypothetical protein